MSKKPTAKDKLPYTLKRDGKTYVRISYHDANNKKRFREAELEIHDLENVLRIRRQLKEAVENKKAQVEVAKINMTVSVLMNAYLAFKKKSLAPRTYVGYSQLIETYIKKYLGKVFVAKLTRDQVQKFLDDVYASGVKSKPRELKKLLKAALDYAILKDIIAANPATLLNLPKAEKAEITFFNQEQAKEFVKTCQSVSHGIIFEFGLFTGMRPEEYLALRWRDIDFEHHRVFVRRAVVYYTEKGAFSFEPLKSNSSRRTIDLTEELIEKLKTWREYITKEHNRLNAQRKKRGYNTKYHHLDLVFPSAFGRPHHYGNFIKVLFRPLLKKANLDEMGFTPYSLRHTCATLLLSNGINIKAVSERLGHSSVKITLDNYVHVLPNMQREASEKMENLLN